MLVISRETLLRQTGSCCPRACKSLARTTKPTCCSLVRWSWFFVLVPTSTFHMSKLVFVASGQRSLWYFLPAKSSHCSLMKHALIGSRLQASTCEPRARGRWVWMQSLVLDSVLELNSLRWSQTQGFFCWIFLLLFCYTCNWSWANSELSSLLPRSLAEILWEATQIWRRITSKPNQSWMQLSSCQVKLQKG